MNDGEYDLGHLKKKSARGTAWRMLVNGQGSWVWAALGSHPCYCSNVRIGTTSLSVGITLQFCFRTFCSLTQLAVLDLRIKISPLLEAMPKSLGLLKCSGRRFAPNEHSSVPREFVQYQDGNSEYWLHNLVCWALVQDLWSRYLFSAFLDFIFLNTKIFVKHNQFVPCSACNQSYLHHLSKVFATRIADHCSYNIQSTTG